MEMRGLARSVLHYSSIARTVGGSEVFFITF